MVARTERTWCSKTYAFNGVGVTATRRNEQPAERIADFVNSTLPNMQHLICQCEMGQSHSGVAVAAVIEHYTDIPSGIFDDNRYYPNDLVYNTVLEAFGEVGNESVQSGESVRRFRLLVISLHCKISLKVL